MTKEEAKQRISELITKYQHLTPAEIKGYHEAKTKQGWKEFTMPQAKIAVIGGSGSYGMTRQNSPEILPLPFLKGD